MRRRRLLHLLFAAAGVACAAGAALQGLRLERAVRANEAVAQAADPAAAVPDLPAARFAQALALARAGRYDAALTAYKTVVQRDRGPLRPAAFYNLGNLHLREALKNGPGGVAAALPLVELSKQAYRDALRADPGDWDARYNLERALSLAPELDEQPVDDNEPQVRRQRTITTAPAMRSDLP